MNNAIKIKDNIYWIGVNDRRTHIFENYWPLPKGVAYNSYVIVDEKVVVIDTVERSRMDDYLDSLQAVLQGRKVDYLIINHMEPSYIISGITVAAADGTANDQIHVLNLGFDAHRHWNLPQSFLP